MMAAGGTAGVLTGDAGWRRRVQSGLARLLAACLSHRGGGRKGVLATRIAQGLHASLHRCLPSARQRLFLAKTVHHPL
jgi:hypothetical protein